MMATKWLTLCFLLAAAELPHAACQHWSYGLNPGGKRDLDGLTDTQLVVDAGCSVLGCEDDSLAKLYRAKTFLAGGRDNAHRTY